MIRINLLPPEIAEKKKQKSQTQLIIAGVVLILVILIGVIVKQSRRLSVVEKEFNEVNIALQKESETVAKVQLLQQKKADLDKRMSVIKKLVKGQFFWVEILDEISQRLPQNVWLGSFTSSDSGVEKILTFSGIAFDNFAIADFITSLDNSHYFGEVELSYIEEGQEIAKIKTLRFVVTCKTKG